MRDFNRRFKNHSQIALEEIYNFTFIQNYGDHFYVFELHRLMTKMKLCNISFLPKTIFVFLRKKNTPQNSYNITKSRRHVSDIDSILRIIYTNDKFNKALVWHSTLLTFDPAICAHFCLDLLFLKFCIIFQFSL